MANSLNSTLKMLRSGAAMQAFVLLGAGVAGSAISVVPAMAQQQPEAVAVGQEEPAGTDIVVTGSRIARPEADSAVPITVIDDTQLSLEGQQNISDVLNELPQVGIGQTRTNTNFSTSGTGTATVNLRALGSSRTLTLVNGRRFIGGFAGDSAVDLNNIPTDFLERVELVTGGSSAVYGSDAVAGVVNFILRDKFKGISVRGQSTLTGKGDAQRYFASVTAGETLGDGRGNILVNYSYDRDEGLFSRQRAISAQDCSGVVCGLGSFSSFAPQGQFRLLSPTGGAIAAVNLPTANQFFSFNPDNSLARLDGFNTGAFGFNRNGVRYISVPVQRHLVSGIANYEITNGIKAFVEATYSNVKSQASLEASPIANADLGSLGYNIDNPFIPAAVAAQIAGLNSDANPANDVGFIGFRRRQNEVFSRSNRASRETVRVATGFKGEIADRFNWEASYVYGRLRDFNTTQDVDAARYRNALDAIRVGPGNVVGTDIVCRDVAARAAGCVPINLFGLNTADPLASAYVQSQVAKSEDIVNTQQVWSANIAGPLFALWAGDVGASIGVEYRKEKTVDDLDFLTNTGGNSGNQIPDLVGQFNVKEVFGELNVPLLKDKSFVKYLGLIGAARYSDYSTIGNVFSWNAGAEFEPISGLRFRGVYAVANRAPNIGELFSQPSETFAAVSDPCDGITAATATPEAVACRANVPAIGNFFTANPTGTFQYSLADIQGINGFVGGNTALKEETAKTYTLGVTVSPQLVRGLIFTADYYNIKIEDAIGSLGRSFSIQQCLLTGAPVFCSQVTRDSSTGFVTTVNGQLINVVTLETSGIDFGIRYQRQLNLLGNDRFSFNGNYTWLLDYKQQSDPTSAKIDSAGTYGNGFSTHRFNVRGTYSIDEFSFSWQTTFTSGGNYIYNDGTGPSVSNTPAVEALNAQPDYWLHDAQARFDLKSGYSFFFGIDNLFDKKPRYLPGTPFGTPTGLETAADYDVIGRRFTAGFKFKL
ncbi:TonB-dependent receptor [Sphingomonas aliaeris]|uniref:TonB-dependent receptor n=1 Tax=Sphingomonas aliaeris TaxID=2759526 RepID=A0A974NUZ7_9SPHN|nr:TonB-dependent receptor [Sphingomonas aliaeris]QQV77461.1 TonB-dependent receptor [Sphingomonas aliaeris]